jgi:hypothetical protein
MVKKTLKQKLASFVLKDCANGLPRLNNRCQIVKSQNMRKPRTCKYGRSSETGKCIRMRFTAKNKPKGKHTWF